MRSLERDLGEIRPNRSHGSCRTGTHESVVFPVESKHRHWTVLKRRSRIDAEELAKSRRHRRAGRRSPSLPDFIEQLGVPVTPGEHQAKSQAWRSRDEQPVAGEETEPRPRRRSNKGHTEHDRDQPLGTEPRYFERQRAREGLAEQDERSIRGKPRDHELREGAVRHVSLLRQRQNPRLELAGRRREKTPEEQTGALEPRKKNDRERLRWPARVADQGAGSTTTAVP